MTVHVRRRSVGAQVAVPVSLVLVAGAAYLLLMASGRVLDGAGFAALTSFYLLANTVGRGTFAVLELELTRSVPRRARGESIVGPVRASPAAVSPSSPSSACCWWPQDRGWPVSSGDGTSWPCSWSRR